MHLIPVVKGSSSADNLAEAGLQAVIGALVECRTEAPRVGPLPDGGCP
jgi:hypothetical protein